MRNLIFCFIMLVFLPNCSPSKKGTSEKKVLEAQSEVNDFDCMKELKEELSTGWKRIEIPCYSEFLGILERKGLPCYDGRKTFERNDSLGYRIQHKYYPCLIGLSQDSILKIFGTTPAVLRGNIGGVDYYCVPANIESDKDGMNLAFFFRSDTLQTIAYRQLNRMRQ